MCSLGFAFAGGGGRIGRQATYLIRSIREFHPTAPILVTVPNSEKLPSSVTDLNVKVVKQPYPDPEYPISIKTEALHQAEQHLNTDWVCLLDTDTLLASPVTAHLGTDAQICVKPVDLATQYWAQAGTDTWHSVYDDFGITPPTMRVKSTVDKEEIWPYWNAGVVLTSADDLGERWRNATIELRSKIEASKHADQVALGVISSDYAVDPLGENHNYPLNIRTIVRPPTTVIHYHEAKWLLCASPTYDKLLDETGISDEFEFSRREWPMVKLLIGSLHREIKSRLGLHTWEGAW